MSLDIPQNKDTGLDPQYLLVKYLVPVLEHKWFVLFCIIVFLTIAVSLSLLVKPEYSSTATIQLKKLETEENPDIGRIDIGQVVDDTPIFSTAIETMRSSTFRTKIIKTFDNRLKTELEVPLNSLGQIKNKLYPLIRKILRLEKKFSTNEKLELENKIKQIQLSRLSGRIHIKSDPGKGTIRITARAFDPTIASLLVDGYIELWKEENINYIKRIIQERLDIARSQLKKDQGYLDEAVQKDLAYRQKIDIPIDRMVVPDPNMQIKLNMLHLAITRATENSDNVNLVVQRLIRLSKSVRDNVIIIDPSQVPFAPSADSRLVIIFFGLILGIALGIAPILALEYYHSYIRHEKDILLAVDIPIIGKLPNIT
ncbi:MAG: Wzz/FepE/Etk N-terminal domain-containing protein [Candidatus Electrothrix communis]|nr:MAG: Wzz/FepE/Etk N-terminal domain-containing protein [Candidatus Electrothrix communis]